MAHNGEIVVLAIRDSEGRLWTVAGYMGAAQPVGHEAEPMLLSDMEELDPHVTEFKVVIPD